MAIGGGGWMLRLSIVDRIHPTVPSPPHASSRRFGTLRNISNLHRFTQHHTCSNFEDNMVEAKAKAKATKLCPRGRGQFSRTPIPGLFTARCYAESGYATSSICPPLSNSTSYCRLLCAYVLSIVFMALSPLLVNHTQKFNVLRPDLEAKAKAAHRRGQGQGQGQGHNILSSSCPRGRGQSSRTHPWRTVVCPATVHSLNTENNWLTNTVVED